MCSHPYHWTFITLHSAERVMTCFHVTTSYCIRKKYMTWWRHQMETFSALLAICAGSSPTPRKKFPAQRPVARNVDIFFDLRLNKRLSKQPWDWWFETLSHPLWRHRNDMNQWWPEMMTQCHALDKMSIEKIWQKRDHLFTMFSLFLHDRPWIWRE